MLGGQRVALILVASGHLITQRPELILPPIFDGNRNCVQVGLHGPVNLREYPAEFGEHGCIFWPWRLGEGVARHRDQLDALLYSPQQVADARRDVDLLMAAGEPMHKAVMEFLDAQLGGRMQRLAGVDFVDFLKLQRR
jgi:hypothetical protein